jgi:hypothetical protein
LLVIPPTVFSSFAEEVPARLSTIQKRISNFLIDRSPDSFAVVRTCKLYVLSSLALKERKYLSGLRQLLGVLSLVIA